MKVELRDIRIHRDSINGLAGITALVEIAIGVGEAVNMEALQPYIKDRKATLEADSMIHYTTVTRFQEAYVPTIMEAIRSLEASILSTGEIK